jgi:transposase, IS5 family
MLMSEQSIATMTARKHRPATSFFDYEALAERISSMDHILWRLKKIIEWERFMPIINGVFVRKAKGPGGRPNYDRLMMTKIMVLKHLYNIPDGQMEQRLLGDFFFRIFLDLTLADATPDEKTIWHFQNELSEAGVIFDLFNAFDAQLLEKGFIAKEGKIVDASIVPVPVQHFTKEEKEALEKGETPKSWEEKPARASQRDTEAEWTKKHKKSYFGYKNHIKSDRKKLIRSFEVTPANDHDSQLMATLIDGNDAGEEMHGDSAYVGKPIESQLRKNKIKNRLHKKAFKNTPLSEYQMKQNKGKSKIRARVEHVFGAMKMKMGDIRVRTIGRIRATFVIGMRNIIYNMCRYDFLKRERSASCA